jgi:hypothetical protein
MFLCSPTDDGNKISPWLSLCDRTNLILRANIDNYFGDWIIVLEKLEVYESKAEGPSYVPVVPLHIFLIDF